MTVYMQAVATFMYRRQHHVRNVGTVVKARQEQFEAVVYKGALRGRQCR